MSNDMYPADVSGAIRSLIDTMYSIWGVRPDRQRQLYIMQTDTYPLTGSATINGTVTGTVSISRSGAFVCVKHSVYMATRDVAITFEFGSSDRRVTSRAHGGHVENIGGTGVEPFIYPKPVVIDGGAQINVTVESLTANSRAIYWDFSGWRVFDTATINLHRRTG